MSSSDTESTDANTDTSTNELDAPEYIRPNQLTLSLEGPVNDILITESDMSEKPAINAAPVPLENGVTIHLPFFLQDYDSNAEELAFSEFFTHTQLDLEQAKEFREQLDTAIEALEETNA